MDNLQGKKLDKLFHQKLENWEEVPPPLAWEKLSKRLENKKALLWWGFAKYAASLIAVLGIGILFYLMMEKGGTQQFTAELEELNKERAPIPEEAPQIEEPLDLGGNEENVRETFSPNQPSPSTRPKSPNSGKKDKTSPGQEESPKSREEIPNLEIPKIDLIEIDLPSLLAEEPLLEGEVSEREVEYKVRIVSRGYAFSPDKGDIVEGIEQQVGKICRFARCQK
jgi:hypothetical protein